MVEDVKKKKKKREGGESSSPARKAEHVASGDSDSSRRRRLLISGLSQSHLLAILKEASGEDEKGEGEGEGRGGVRRAERKVTEGGRDVNCLAFHWATSP